LANGEFEKIAHNYAVLWSKGIIKVMPWWSIEISGRENLPKPDEAVVIAANHESMADIWGLYCLGVQFRWLSKAEVFKVPLIGRAMRWARYIPIRRGDKGSHSVALDDSAATLKRGIPMAFFPEGTRSLDGNMRPFKIGAFRLADENNVPILPIALKGAGGLIRKGSGLPFPATIKIKILPPTRRLPDEDYEKYARRVQLMIQNAHREL
jgi:1-acyl-sn-glycerol-3-phosphate acyltransferase